MPKKRKIRKIHASSRKNSAQQLKILEYDISYDPIQDKNYNKLPDHIKDKIDNFYYLIQKNPDPETISDLENLIEKFPNVPNVPMLYNYLSVAYSHLKNREKILEIVEKNYRMNPDYLFARLNYAEICIQNGDYEKIAENHYKILAEIADDYPITKKLHKATSNNACFLKDSVHKLLIL